jgi:hypothetical protein
MTSAEPLMSDWLVNDKMMAFSTLQPGADASLKATFDVLRQKWGVVPAGQMNRINSSGLLNLPDRDFLARWVEFLVGGRWLELAYPKARWEREGRMPFEKWGEKTDGGAPWMEWHDIEKVRWYLAPAKFELVLAIEYHNSDFNWFDLVRTS